MGKFDGILLCTDLDGTLLKKDKTISKENFEAIEYFKREGGKFTFVTGRMPYYVVDMYNTVKPNAPIGCANGGGVYDFETGEYVWTEELSNDVIELVKEIDEKVPGAGIQLVTFYNTYFCKENDAMERFRQVTGVPHLTAKYTELNKPLSKILFGSNIEEEILEMERILNAHPLADKFSFTRTGKPLYEILPRNIGKGTALVKIAERLGIDIKNTVAVGDYNNDISMFKAAGVGIAVANACQAAKDAADFITVSHEESAIARVIYDIEAGKFQLV